MHACLICENTDLIELERRSNLPVAQNLILETREAALDCPVGDILMLRCTACGFVWNAAFDPAKMAYDATYDNDQNFSSRFRDHTEAVARLVTERMAVPGAERLFLLEVGCGQGKFMSILEVALGQRLDRALGYDPAWRGDRSALPAFAEVEADYFTPSVAARLGAKPDLVVSRHVIEHVPDPVEFVDAIRTAVGDETVAFIETPDVDWILRNSVFFDFYYEHCSLFSREAIRVCLERAGFAVEDVRAIFDDQYMVAVARGNDAEVGAEPLAPGRFDDLGYREGRDAYLTGLKALIDRSNERGKTAFWGGASKGVTLCLVLEDAERIVDCAIDINARKQGCYLPVSGIPIVSPAEAYARGVRTVIVVNSAYVDEVQQLCDAEGLEFRVIPIDAVRAAS